MSRLSKLYQARVLEGERCGYIQNKLLPHVVHICSIMKRPKCKYCGIGKSPAIENLKDSWEALDEQT